MSSWRDFKGSLREGAPAERVEEHAQQTLVRVDMASASRLHRGLLPSPCGATSLSEGGLYCDRKQDGEILKASPRCEKCICFAATARNATDEGAKSYGMRNRRTLIRRLRRHLPYLREGLQSECEHTDKHQFINLTAKENCHAIFCLSPSQACP